MPPDHNVEPLDTIVGRSTDPARRGKQDVMVRFRVNDGPLQIVSLPAETYTEDLARQAIAAKLKTDSARKLPPRFKVTIP